MTFVETGSKNVNFTFHARTGRPHSNLGLNFALATFNLALKILKNDIPNLQYSHPSCMSYFAI